MKRTLLIIVCIGAMLAANAQVSRFLEKGQSGIGIRLGAEKTYGVGGYSAQAGGSIKGIVDIETSFTKDLYDPKKLGLKDDNPNASIYELWVNWWVVRKQIIPSIDVNLAVWGEICDGNFYNYSEIDTGSTYYQYQSYLEGQFGFEVSLNFRITDSWWIQPGCFAYYAMGREKWDELGVTTKNNYQGVGSSISLAVVKRIKKSSLYFMANQYFDSYEGSANKYKISIGYIFGL
jgi:hypothetical protein